MGLTMSYRRSLTAEVVGRYRRAGKKQKGVILGEFVKSSGYKRKYAIHLLNSWGRARWVHIDGKLVKLVVGRPRRAKRRLRPRRYDQEVLSVLKQIWYVFDCMCGKWLVVVLRTMLPVLESFGCTATSVTSRSSTTCAGSRLWLSRNRSTRRWSIIRPSGTIFL